MEVVEKQGGSGKSDEMRREESAKPSSLLEKIVMSYRLFIPADLFAQMLAHAHEELPNECCGLLSGIIQPDLAIVQCVRRLINARASPTEYEADGRSMLQACRAMEAEKQELLAVYHSHPTSQPIPSGKDLDWGMYENVMQLIISLQAQPSVRGWWFQGRQYHEAQWTCDPSGVERWQLPMQ
jgi:proteasome lid subunit RPN8/RPN11